MMECFVDSLVGFRIPATALMEGLLNIFRPRGIPEINIYIFYVAKTSAWSVAALSDE